MNSTNGLLGEYDNWRIKDWAKYWIRVTLGLGDQRIHRRVIRTKDFISRYMKRTPYHFYQWNEVLDESGKGKPGVILPDLIIVGSDQVWNPRWESSLFYLGKSFPVIPRIAYAASIGINSLEEVKDAKHWKEYNILNFYQSSLKQFKAISCREKEACDLVEKLGITADHVVDPVLLLPPKTWNQLTTKHLKKKILLCYFLFENIDSYLEPLEKFAVGENCIVKILHNGIGRKQHLPFINVRAIIKYWFNNIVERQFKFRHIHIIEDAGPMEFLNLHANATWILTDSFHSLMFSCIFNKNCRIISPKNPIRKGMFSRIKEVADNVINGQHLIVNELQEALISFASNEMVTVSEEWLTSRRDFSQNWLRNQLIK